MGAIFGWSICLTSGSSLCSLREMAGVCCCVASADFEECAENRMKEMVQGPQGGLGSLYDTDDETKPDWDRPRLLGGAEGKKFGIISCLICFCCFPCGLLAICFPCDSAE